jgi:hypothetical protein
MKTIQEAERDELAALIYETYLNSMGAGPLSPRLTNTDIAAAIIEDGYRKPRHIQYVVVTQDGAVYDCSFGSNREAALAVAESATADARSVALDYTYRVAELVEL